MPPVQTLVSYLIRFLNIIRVNRIHSDDDDPDQQPAATSDGLSHVVDTGNPTRLQSFLDAIVRVKREFTACGGTEVQGTYGESVPR